jgi:nitroreductase
MEFKEVIGRRRSIRYFQPWRPVEREKVQSILEAAHGRQDAPGTRAAAVAQGRGACARSHVRPARVIAARA